MKAIFEYSEALDTMLTEMALQPFNPKQIVEMHNYKTTIESNWRKIESRAITLIESCSGLRFKMDAPCYVVKTMEFRALSSPLIIRKEPNIRFTEIILIHELIHILLTENRERIANYINAAYPSKDHEFKIHIPVLLIQKKVMEGLFPREEIDRFLKQDEDNLKEEWIEANKHIHKYKNDIVKFLENENDENP